MIFHRVLFDDRACVHDANAVEVHRALQPFVDHPVVDVVAARHQLAGQVYHIANAQILNILIGEGGSQYFFHNVASL